MPNSSFSLGGSRFTGSDVCFGLASASVYGEACADFAPSLISYGSLQVVAYLYFFGCASASVAGDAIT